MQEYIPPCELKILIILNYFPLNNITQRNLT